MITFFQNMPVIIKLIIGINLFITGYQWVGQPVVVNTPFFESLNSIAGFSIGFLICINTNEAQKGTKYYEAILRHEYVHYVQQAYFTPLGFSLYTVYNIIKNFVKYGFKSYFFLYYTDNYFENQAYELMYDESIKIPKFFSIDLPLDWKK